MSGRPAPSPSVQYIPAPPPPAPPTQVPTQSLTTQISLDQISAAQQQLNALLGSQLDQANSEFNTTQSIRQTQASGAENRLTIMTTGEQNRMTQGQAIQGNLALGAQNIGGQLAVGAQNIKGNLALGAQNIGGQLAVGAQNIGGQLATIGKTAEEVRSTNLQQEMFRRYQNNLDYSRASNAYHA